MLINLDFSRLHRDQIEKERLIRLVLGSRLNKEIRAEQILLRRLTKLNPSQLQKG